LQKHLLSQTGKAVFDDLRLAAQASNKVLTELDDGALVTDILDTVKRIQEKIPTDVDVKGSTKAAKELADETQSAARTLVHVAKLTATSAEFRRILGNGVEFLSDFIQTWTGKAEEVVDDAKKEVKDASKKVADAADSATDKVDGSKVKDAADKAQSTAQNLLQKGEISDHKKGGLVQSKEEGGSVSGDFESVNLNARGISQEAERYKEQTKDTLKEGKEQVEKIAQKAVDAVQEKIQNLDISDEDRERIMTNFKNIVLDIQAHPDYKPAVKHLQNLFKRMRRTVKPIVDAQLREVEEKAKEGSLDSEVAHLEELLEQAVQKFARGKDLSPLKSQTRELFNEIKEDEDFEKFLDDLTEFLGKSVQEPKFVESTDYSSEFNDFFTRGSALLDKKSEYRTLLKSISKELRTIGRYISTDPGLQALDASVRALTKDAFFDDKGRPVVKTELLEDLRRVLPSIIKENLANVPLPRLEYSDEDYDFVLDNVVLHGDAIVPRYVTVDTRTTVDTTEESADKALTMHVRVQLTEMYISADDIHFSYKKKTGIPHISDTGFLDFATPHSGKGITLECTLSPNFTEQKRSFDLVETKCEIDSLDIKIHDVKKHTILYKLFKPIIDTVVRKKTEDAICSKIFDTLFSVDGAVQKYLNA